MFICIFFAISIVVFIAGFAIIGNSQFIFGNHITSSDYRTLNILLLLMIFNLVIVLLGSVFHSLIGANEEFFFQRILLVLSSILNPLLTIPLLFMGLGSTVIVIVQTVINSIIFVLNIAFCLKKLHIKFSFRNFDFPLLKELFRFSFFIFLQQIMDICNWQVDKYLITRFWGAAAVAVYSVGAQFNAVILPFSTTISAVFLPQANRMVAEKKSKEEITALFIKTGRVQFIIVSFVVLAFVFFGKRFISFWAGSGYENAYYVGLFLLIPLIIPLSQELGMTIMRAKSLHKMQMMINAGVALINLLISIPLCKAFGEIGAACGTFVGMLIASNILQSIYYEKVGGLDISRWFGQIVRILPAFIAPAITGIVVINFLNMSNIAVFMVCVSLFSVIYFSSIWFIGMNNYEKKLVTGPFRELVAKITGRYTYD
jgi:O-antigen/teichoic acid export membrane protein